MGGLVRKQNPVSWWDMECEDAIELRKGSLKKLKKDKSLKDRV